MTALSAGSSKLVDGIRAHDLSALARAISLVENAQPGFEHVLTGIRAFVGRAHRIGVTGPPGAGKSTLVECFIRSYRERDHTVAVVAVDPTSPYSGGALLGDRVRMDSAVIGDGVFVRSMATRGATGGLATTTQEVCDVLDAFGFDRIIVETVGIGQSELAITDAADTSVLVLVPESGDSVQVLKAGVMEIADLFVVNKADRSGAELVARDIRELLAIRLEQQEHASSGGWRPTVTITQATACEGVETVVDTIERHAAALRESGLLDEQRRARLRRHTQKVIERALRRGLWKDSKRAGWLAGEIDRVTAGELSCYQVADQIVAAVLGPDARFGITPE